MEGHHKCVQAGLCINRQFSKRYTIYADINVDAITSRRTTDGVLQLAIPKAGRRSIHVAVAEESQSALPEPAAAASQSVPQADSAGAAPEQKLEEVTIEVVKD